MPRKKGMDRTRWSLNREIVRLIWQEMVQSMGVEVQITDQLVVGRYSLQW